MKAPHIYVFDQQFKVHAILGNYTSLIFNRLWHGIGGFEIRIHPHAYNADRLQRGRIITLSKQWHKAGIITGIKLTNERGKKELLVTGRQLKGITAYRNIRPPTEEQVPGSYGWDRATGTAEEVMQHYINRHMVNPFDANRKIEQLSLEPQGDPSRGIIVPWSARWEPLSKHLEEISAWCDAGWNISFDYPNRHWLWTYEPGRDLAYGNPSITYVAFDDRYGALRNVQYTADYADYANTFEIGGAGEDEARLIQTVYTDEAMNQLAEPLKGVDRIESFVDAGNIDMPDDLIAEGLHRIRKSAKPIRAIEAQVSPEDYETKWDLGDRTTIALHASHTGVDAFTHERITAVQEGYTRGECRLTVTWGEDAPVIADALERMKYQTPVR